LEVASTPSLAVIILDTNVVSEVMKPVPSRTVTAWLSGRRDELFTTAITVAEILYGIELLPKGRRRDSLQESAEATLAVDFADHILDYDESAARIFALISSVRRSHGRPIGIHDAQIAAIAKCHHAALATRDVGDFEGCGLRLVNPWEGGNVGPAQKL
jgi:toxin FitB